MTARRPEGGGCAVQGVLSIEGPLDAGALRRALDRVCARHEILRTRFRERAGLSVPVQVVTETGFTGWRTMDPEAVELDQLLAGERDTPFDLAEGPSLRAVLVRLEADRHVLVLTLPILCADRRSVSNLFEELPAAYGASAGEEGSLRDEEEIVQFVQFSEWHHELLADGDAEDGKRFWRDRLQPDRPPVVLPFEGRGGRQGMRLDDSVSRDLESGATAELERMTADRGLEADAFVLACWLLHLARLAGDTGPRVNVVSDGRRYEELDSVLGPVYETLELEIPVHPDRPFHELWRRVDRELSEACEWQEYLAGVANGDTGPGAGAIGFEFGRLPSPLTVGGVRFTAVRLASSEPFKVKLSCLRHEGRLELDLAYDATRWTRDAAQRVLEQVVAVVEHACEAPDAPIRSLSSMKSGERRELLVERNRTSFPLPSGETLPRLFARQVNATPSSVALAFRNDRLTYRELERRAERLAGRLARFGVGPDVRVGLLLERSLELGVAVLAVSKAGGAYVPLDPSYPPRRVVACLDDSSAKVLLTSRRLLGHLSEAYLPATVCLDEDEPAESEPAAPPPLRQPDGANLAYVVYTSGTTGRPKGVMVSHRSLANYLEWAREAYGSAAGTGSLVHTPLGFDLTVTSFLLPLVSGGGAVLVPEAEGVAGLGGELQRSGGYGLLKLTPSHLQLLNAQLSPEAMERAAASLILGGEALHERDLAPWRRRAPGIRLVNEYGPTEATVGCIAYVAPARAEEEGPVPIGSPVGNVRAYVVDSALEPVALGVPGEILVGGTGLARGYLGRPAATAEAFVPDPFGEEPGGRVYRTGDVGRHLLDEGLGYGGRLDDQLKLRGHRIEPEEIQALALEDPEVEDVVVVDREISAGDRRLVAYVVPRDPATFSAESLRLRFERSLPEPMVPAVISTLPALPLTPHGKVDRSALPEPEEEGSRRASYVAPRTQTEALVASTFGGLLRVETVGVEDDFFRLGGHSLLATRLVSRVRDAFGVELSLKTLFDEPTVAGLARKIEDLRAGGDADPLPPIRPAGREDPLPLSFGQQRLWFIDQLQPGSDLYNIPVPLRFDGGLDLRVMAATLTEVIRRHEVLRTTFEEIGDEVQQVVGPAVAIRLPVVDLSALPEERREPVARELARQEGRRPFNLTEGPLVRNLVLRLAAALHVSVLTLHHIVSDGWSAEVLVAEVAELYRAFLRGEDSPLPDLPIQYADFAVWQRRLLGDAVIERELGYWRRKLSGAPKVLELPTDHPRPAVHRFRGAERSFVFPDGVAEDLRRLAREEGATLFLVLLAAFEVLLHRYGVGNDLCVGTPVSGRSRSELEGLIGFFVNTLVLRSGFEPSDTFLDVLRRVRSVALEAHEHQHLPFERLVDELQPERSMSHTPLFQVVFLLENERERALTLPGLSATPFPVETDTAKFDLILATREHAGRLEGALQYNTDLFDASTAARLVRHFGTLAASVAASSHRHLLGLDLLSPGERHQVALEWNDTRTGFSRARRLHELFEEQAGRDPEALAVACGDRSSTYGEVDAEANRLARRLCALGAEPGELVAVIVERSLEMVPALLAVHKAGGAYVPLEPSFPAARIAWILESLGVRFLITQQGVLDSLAPVFSGLPRLEHVLCLDAPGREEEGVSAEAGPAVWGTSAWRELPPERPASPGSADDFAYVIFTSGSTGRPKGVMVRHRPVVNLIEWVNRSFSVGPRDRVLFVASLCFDLSVYDVFGVLAAGGSIQVVPTETVRDPEALIDLMCSEPVTFWDSAPAALQQLVPFLSTRRDRTVEAGLRLVFLSGDWIPLGLPDAVREAFPAARVVGLGGATEATVWSNVFPVGEVDPAWPSIPYGRPIQNAEYRVLDAALGPVPVGVEGDLYIGGDCLASGYLGEASLTARSFVPDPYNECAGAMLYRTGDRTRQWPDGLIEFRGRRDQQVKIRGFRIELGEIQTVLAQHPSVRHAVVVIRDEDAVGRRLVAYVVPRSTPSPEVAELRSHVASRVPEYMVPSAFVLLETLPVTENGKLDRAALPAPEAAERAAGGPGSGSTRDAVKDLLAAVWAELLGVERVDDGDGFFDLGGHSILATRLVARVQELFGVRIPLQRLFERPGLAEFARDVAEALRAPALREVPHILPQEPEGRHPVSFAQQRLWFLDQLDPGSAAYNVFHGVRIRGRLDLAVLRRALFEVLRRHAVLRATFTEADGEPVQVIGPPAPVPLPLVDVSALRADRRDRELHRLAEAESFRPFDLERGPLLRPVLVRVGAGVSDDADHAVLVTTHHIVSDAWSVVLLVDEVTTVYEALDRDLPPPLEELRIQYADYARWQREWLQGEVLEEQVSFWRGALAGSSPQIELPRRPGGETEAVTSAGGRVTQQLSAETVRHLREVAGAHGATLAMTLLAVFYVLLHRYSGQEDLVVGADVAGRDQPGTESLIGFFINMLVLRAAVTSQTPFRALLAQVRKATLDAYSHQALPFERVVEELQPERTSGHSPLFEVVFNYQPAVGPQHTDGAEAGDGLEISTLSVERTTARFDLSLLANEDDDLIVVTWLYRLDRFEPETVQEMSRAFARLVESAAESPETHVGRLEMLSDQERLRRSRAEESREGAKLTRLLETQTAAGDSPGARKPTY